MDGSHRSRTQSIIGLLRHALSGIHTKTRRQFRLSTYVAPGAAGMYKSNNVRKSHVHGCARAFPLLPASPRLMHFPTDCMPCVTSEQARLLLEFTRKNAGGVYDWRATKVGD